MTTQDRIDADRAEAMAHLGAALTAMTRAAQRADDLARAMPANLADAAIDLANTLRRDARMIALVVAPPRELPHPDDIAEAVCRRFRISPQAILAARPLRRSRTQAAMNARMVLTRSVLALRPDMSFPDLARWAGDRSHSTWVTAHQRCGDRPDLLRIMDEVVAEFTNRPIKGKRVPR